MDLVKSINGHVLEYLDDGHIYLVDGVIVPSITRVMNVRFGKKYESVDRDVLKRASDAGIAVHEAIERYCKDGEVTDLKELRNFQFLQKQYGFEIIENEVPVIIWKDEKPVCAGRLDMVIKMDGELGGADIKRTAVLDKEYLAYQLNLYRIGYLQSYGEEWKFLRGIHLRNDVRKFVTIPVNEQIAWEILNEYLEETNE